MYEFDKIISKTVSYKQINEQRYAPLPALQLMFRCAKPCQNDHTENNFRGNFFFALVNENNSGLILMTWINLHISFLFFVGHNNFTSCDAGCL